MQHLIVAIAVGVLTIAPSAVAQTGPVNGVRPADVRTHAITGATVVVQPDRTIENATILIRNGVIEAVGQDVEVPPGARVWPGDGLTVYPGLIDAAVMIKPDSIRGGPGAHWNSKIHPEWSAADELLPPQSVRKEMRSLGFTTAAVYPNQGVLRGSGVVIALADKDEHALAYDGRAMMAAGFDRGGGYPGSLMGAIALLRQTFYDAHWHNACRRVWQEYPQGNEPPIRADALVALEEVVNGRQAVLFEASDEHNALRAARLAREFDLDLVLLGSGYEFRRIDDIVSLGVPIVVPLQFPDRPDVSALSSSERVTLRELMTWEQAPTNARRLVEAGATIALTTHRLRKRSDFYPNLRLAVKHGLDDKAALAALTTVPAKLLGLDHIIGTIEAGKAANLVVVKGSLFKKKPKIRDVWINGRRHEISKEPQIKMVSAGTLETDLGITREVRVDTTKKSVTVQIDDEKIKAKKVVVQKDHIAFVVDGRPFDADGYVRLSGVLTEGTIVGTGALPDGHRFAFTISPHEDENDESPKAIEDERTPDEPDNDTDEQVDDGLSGTWSAEFESDMMPAESSSFSLILELQEDQTVFGSLTSPTFSADVSNGSFNKSDGSLTFTVQSDEFSAEVHAQVQGDSMTGQMKAGEMSFDFSANRTAFDSAGSGDEDETEEDDEDFQMPTEELVYPLGAYGFSQPPEAQDVLIINATVWTSGPDGIIEDGELEIRGAKIVYVGPTRAHADTEDLLVIDAGGKHITAGLVDCHSHTGISGGVNETGQTNTAEVRIGDVINPDDINFYRQLAGGLTGANQLHGSANPIGGQNSVIKLKWGGSAEAFRIPDAIAGIKFALGENVTRSRSRYPNSRMGVETFIRDGFIAARDYRAEWDRYLGMSEEHRARTMPPRRDLELDTLVEILNGQRLVHCHSYRQDEILMLIRVADEFGFTIGTFQHVLEGYKVAEAIASHGAGASTFSDWWAYKIEVMDAIPYNGALMHDVGVIVSFNSDSSELARRMNTEAAKAVRYGGLDPQDALNFVTINPARQLRIDHRTGSLEVGKDADFVIWSESPLSTYARCEQTWIEGARYFDLNRDRELRASAQAQRQRLIQRVLREAHGKLKATETDEPATPSDPAAEGASAAEPDNPDPPYSLLLEDEPMSGHWQWPTSIVAAAILAAGSPAAAQSQQIPAPPQDHPVIIHSATIHTVSSDPIEDDGYVVFDKGVISDVGRGRPPQLPGAEVIDAHGLYIYPGFIAAETTLGLVETQSVQVTVDTTELGRVTPEVRAAVAVNPDSSLIPVARSNGILTGMVFPRGGLVAGRCSTIRLDGWTWEQMAIDAEAGLVVNWPRTEPSTGFSFRRQQSEAEQRKQIAESLEEIERLFDDAVAYFQARESDPTQATDLRYEAMRGAISGEKPVFVQASSVGQIESAIAWATRRDLRIVLVGGQEADKAIPLILKHDVPVIISGLHRLPRHRYEPYDSPFTLPASLYAAGVRFAIASGTSPAHERNLNHNAATAVAFGLGRSEALRAVTLSAAEILGLGDTHGSIEVGKAATLIITQGDPLQITTNTLVAFIDGRRIDLGNRQKTMHRKYREKYRQLGLLDDS